MRYVLALLVLLALQFVPGVARATYVSDDHPDKASAYAHCVASAKEEMPNSQGCALTTKSGVPAWQECGSAVTNGGISCTSSNFDYHRFPSANGGCPAGSTWDDASKTCFDAQKCLAHNEEEGFKGVGEVTRAFQKKCVGGCDYEIQSPYSYTSAGGTTFYTGEYMFTGTNTSCAVPENEISEEEAQEKKPQECTPGGTDATGMNYSFCVKANGNQCWTSTSGKQVCWTPGEVGEKTDGPVLQKRNAGTQPVPPVATPPEGSTFEPKGPPVSSITYVGSYTINTTIQNYQTDTGVNAGPTSSGEPATGTGGQDDTEQPGQVVGGEGCDEQPVVTGDPLLANIVLQTWGTRCAAEAANAVKATGDIEKCSSPFTVTGPEDDPNTHKLRAIRKQFCPDEEDTHPEGAAGDYGTGTDPDEGSIQGQVFGTGTEVGADGLDDSGFGWTRTCPQMPIIEVMGATLDFNLPEMCDWMKLGGQLVLILAAMGSLRLMAPGV